MIYVHVSALGPRRSSQEWEASIDSKSMASWAWRFGVASFVHFFSSSRIHLSRGQKSACAPIRLVTCEKKRPSPSDSERKGLKASNSSSQRLLSKAGAAAIHCKHVHLHLHQWCFRPDTVSFGACADVLPPSRCVTCASPGRDELPISVQGDSHAECLQQRQRMAKRHQASSFELQCWKPPRVVGLELLEASVESIKRL